MRWVHMSEGMFFAVADQMTFIMFYFHETTYDVAKMKTDCIYSLSLSVCPSVCLFLPVSVSVSLSLCLRASKPGVFRFFSATSSLEGICIPGIHFVG